jgi:glycosyltransferase involved in cell wall biosynthesis
MVSTVIFFSVNENLVKSAQQLREEKKIDIDAWVWIFVGRLVKDKGIGELLDAFQKIHHDFPGDRLWLLGTEEPELDPLDAQHQEILHTHPAIQCWGFQKDIRPYLAAAQVLVFPSYQGGVPQCADAGGINGLCIVAF